VTSERYVLDFEVGEEGRHDLKESGEAISERDVG
jgi:hypothetical protein